MKRTKKTPMTQSAFIEGMLTIGCMMTIKRLTPQNRAKAFGYMGQLLSKQMAARRALASTDQKPTNQPKQ
jgi:hypothetical protein